jgi:hypothetical protein
MAAVPPRQPTTETTLNNGIPTAVITMAALAASSCA